MSNAKKTNQEFTGHRPPQSDRDFLIGCGLTSERASDALGIRRAIANLAEVDVGAIHSSDTFDGDLARFAFWGSLDSMAVILELEECLGIKIDDTKASQIHNPESRPGTTVAQFVQNVLQVLHEETH